MTVAKREASLRAMLNKNASESRLLKGAEAVRCARIQVLRARIGEIPLLTPTHRHDRRIAKLNGQIELLLTTNPLSILAEFRKT